MLSDSDHRQFVTAGYEQHYVQWRNIKGMDPVFFTGVYAFQFEQAWLDV